MHCRKLAIVISAFCATAIFTAPAYAADAATVSGALTFIWSALAILCVSGVVLLLVENRAYRKELVRNQNVASKDGVVKVGRQANDDAILPDAADSQGVQAA